MKEQLKKLAILAEKYERKNDLAMSELVTKAMEKIAQGNSMPYGAPQPALSGMPTTTPPATEKTPVINPGSGGQMWMSQEQLNEAAMKDIATIRNLLNKALNEASGLSGDYAAMLHARNSLKTFANIYAGVEYAPQQSFQP
jgi:hypothetical protein